MSKKNKKNASQTVVTPAADANKNNTQTAANASEVKKA